MKLKYFSSVKGHAVSRYGTREFIGATRGKDGHVWDTDAVTAIPEAEYYRYLREYTRAIKSKSLKKRTKADYDKAIKAQEDKTNKEVAERKKKAAEKKQKGSAGRGPDNEK